MDEEETEMQQDTEITVEITVVVVWNINRPYFLRMEFCQCEITLPPLLYLSLYVIDENIERKKNKDEKKIKKNGIKGIKKMEK